MKQDHSLFQYLAKGGRFSIAHLAEVFNLPQQQIHRQIEQLLQQQCSGMSLVQGDVIMQHPIEVLSAKKIIERVPFEIPPNIEVFESLNSSNQYLLDKKLDTNILQICAAEYQSEGRGRQGRQWHMPMAGHLSFSMSKCLPHAGAYLSLLSLAAGVCAIRTLKQSGIHDLFLKWPNDIVMKAENDLIKIGGILIETRHMGNKGMKWVMGIGINIEETRTIAERVNQPVSGLKELTQNSHSAQFSRNGLIADFIANWQQIEMTLENDQQQILEQWRQFDILANKEISVFPAQDEPYFATANGIDNNGCLIVTIDNQTQHLTSAEVKVRISQS